MATASEETLIQLLQQTVKNGQSSSGGQQLKTFIVELTRTTGALATTTYSAGDLVGDAVSLTKVFSNVAKATGTGVRICRVSIQTNDTGVVAGSKFNLYIYRDAPDTTGLSDNGVVTLNYANANKRAGKIPVVMDGLTGSNDYNVVGLNPVGRDVIVMLETVSGFTPISGSKFTIIIDCELSNN